MILFVLNQVAGAEYCLSLLQKWKRESTRAFKVLATNASGKVLQKHSIVYEPLPENLELESIESLLTKLSPEIVVASTSMSNSVELKFVQAANKRGIASLQFIDTWSNYAERFQLGQEFIFPRQILTLNTYAKDEMLEAGIPGGIIRIVGQPHLEKIMSTKAFEHGENGGLLVVTQPVSKFFGRNLGYDESTFVEGVSAVFDRASIPRSKRFLAIHPAESRQAYVDRWSEKFQIVDIENLREEVSICIGMFSSVMVQCALLGIPVVAFQPNAVGPNKCGLSRMSFIPRALSEKELEHFLSLAKTHDGLLPGISEFRKLFFGSSDRFEASILAVLK